MIEKIFDSFNFFFKLKRELRTLIPTFLILVPAITLQAQQTNKQSQIPDSRALTANIEKFVAPYLQMQDFSGSILVSRDGRILYEKGFGMAV